MENYGQAISLAAASEETAATRPHAQECKEDDRKLHWPIVVTMPPWHMPWSVTNGNFPLLVDRSI